MIYSVALQICRNQHTAEDITSLFFMRLKKAAMVYKGGCGHKKWLAVSARNLTLNYIQRQSREVPEDISDEKSTLSSTADPKQFEESTIAAAATVKALSILEDNDREIVNLKVYGGFTFGEISDILKIPPSTVAWHYRTALGRLKKYYEEEADL